MDDPPTTRAVRHLDCGCGFHIESTDLGELIEHAQRHARLVHGMELASEQIADLVWLVDERPTGA